MSEALNIIKDETLTYNQELIALARLGESTDDTIVYSDEYYAAKEKRARQRQNEVFRDGNNHFFAFRCHFKFLRS